MSAVENACDKLAAACGYTVRRLSQTRHSRICEGLPDRRYVNVKQATAFFFECKSTTDKITREQYYFIDDELDAGALAGVGGYAELAGLIEVVRHCGVPAASAYCRQVLEEWRIRGFRGEAKALSRVIVTRTRSPE